VRIAGSKKSENAESLAEAHTLRLCHDRETKYYRLDIKGTGKYWKLCFPHFLCSYPGFGQDRVNFHQNPGRGTAG